MTAIDLSRNRALAMRARLSITNARMQTMIVRWLLEHPKDQAQADRNLRIIEVCAEVSGTNLNELGDWDALAHCVMHSLWAEDGRWVDRHSGAIDLNAWRQGPDGIIADLFGRDRFAGNPYVERFDSNGDAMRVGAARW